MRMPPGAFNPAPAEVLTDLETWIRSLPLR
jgi:hypothetical protein